MSSRIPGVGIEVQSFDSLVCFFFPCSYPQGSRGATAGEDSNDTRGAVLVGSLVVPASRSQTFCLFMNAAHLQKV